MSLGSFIVIIAAICLAGIFVMYKKGKVNKLNNAMQNKQFDQVIAYSENPSFIRMIGEYNCDLYRLKAIFFSRGEEERRLALETVLSKDYELEKKEFVLDIYFHIYLQKQDREYCDVLMEYIDEISDETFKMYQHWAYEVMFNKRTDLIDAMDEAIENKQLKGFGLGVTAYMIGLQYDYLENYDLARSYFYTCIGCFRPGDLYVDLAKKKVDELTEKMNALEEY